MRGARHFSTPPVRRTGHALLELLAVLALLGLAAGAVAPALQGLGEDGVDRAARQLTHLLRATRALALDRRMVVTAILDPVTGRYWIVDEREQRIVAVDSVILDAVNLVADARRARFTFEPTGGATGRPLVIRSAARAQVLDIDPWTGEPRVQRR